MKLWFLLSVLLFLAPNRNYAMSKGKPIWDHDVYRLIEIEDHRLGTHPFLLKALHGKSSQLRARALLTLGRIGDPSMAASVTPFLLDPEIQVRLNAAFALGLLKNPESLEALEKAVSQEKSPTVRAQIYAALGRLQNPGVIPILQNALNQEKNSQALSGLAMGFCFLFLAADAASWSISPDTLLILMNQLKTQAPLSVSAAWALARYKGDLDLLPEKSLLTALSETREPEAKAIALKALARHKTETSRQFLSTMLRDGESQNLRIEAANGLAGQSVNDEMIKALLHAANQDQNLVRAAALSSLASFQGLDTSVQKILRDMITTQPSSWLQGKAYLALAAQLPVDQRLTLIQKGMQHPDVYVQRELIALLPQLGAEGLHILARKADDKSLLVSGAAVNALHGLEKDQMNEILKAVMLKQLERHDAVISSLVIDAAGKFNWQDTLPLLIKCSEEKWALDDYPVQENFMGVLAIFADPITLPLIEKNLQHPVRTVVVKAAEAYQKITGKSPEKPLPLNHRVDDVTPSINAIKGALQSEIILDTNKGRIRMVMLDSAPLTATKVVQWATQGFYNGLNFHRVVPHWVVQGGDPRGDGEGGNGLIRDEVSMTPHLPYTVGIATAGKDTGSTQMFINLGNNTRLDGSYTVFAQVIEGRDVVDRLEIGDKINKATVQSFRGT